MRTCILYLQRYSMLQVTSNSTDMVPIVEMVPILHVREAKDNTEFQRGRTIFNHDIKY